MLKITGGFLKGRKLSTPKGRDIRPTLEKTREALFSVLASRYDLSAYKTYDLFAGSGALGFEALSRGCSNVVFIENDKSIYSIIKRNAEQLNVERHCSVVLSDAVKWIQKKDWNGDLRLFLLDPPYKTDLTQKALEMLNLKKNTLIGSLVVVETDKRNQIDYPPGFSIFQQKSYGKTRVDFIQIESADTP